MNLKKDHIRKFLFVILAAVILAIVLNWSLVAYGVRQGIGQMAIVWNARPVEAVYNDPTFPDSLKAKLRMIDEVRKYAIDSLGLVDTQNYRTLYDQQGKEIIWVVTASEAFRLKPKLWSFPVVGTVPYKGFFNQSEAIKEAAGLRKEGWDVSIRNPGGWSTLGWFTDPILTGMLKRSEGDLASLIIHEMVHATLWVPDSTEFNENLASFIGDTAAYSFLRWKYGQSSSEYTRYLHEDQDYHKFSRFILRASTSLDSLYQTMDETMPIDKKQTLKDSAIHAVVVSMDTLNLYLNPAPSKRYEKQLPNNAYFLAYRHYQSRQSDFKGQFNRDFNGNLREYIDYWTEKYPAF